MKNKQFHLPTPLRNSKFLINLTSALTVVLLITAPTQAQAVTAGTVIKDSEETYLDFKKKQGADGSYWVWRHKRILEDNVQCPPTSVKDCPLFPVQGPAEMLPGKVFVTLEPSWQIFSVKTLNPFYDPEAEKNLTFRLNNRDDFIKKFNSKQVRVTLVPKPDVFTLKPGEYAFISLIALDKWVPLNTGYIKNGIFSDNNFKYDGKIGTWEGHVFKNYSMHVCINTTGKSPKVGDKVTCRAPATPPKGTSV